MKLEKIVFIKDDGTEVSLTKEEANSLYNELHTLFGKENITYTQPPYLTRDILNPMFGPITCDNTGSKKVFGSGSGFTTS